MVLEFITNYWTGGAGVVQGFEPTVEEDMIGELFRETMETRRPRLNIDDVHPERFDYSIKVISKEPMKVDDLVMSLDIGFGIRPKKFTEQEGKQMWMYRFSVPRKQEGYYLTYQIMDHIEKTYILGQDESPRLLYGSCWDIEYPNRRAEVDHVTPVLQKAHAQHKENPYSVVVGGGDQIYLDDCLNVIPEFRDLSFEEKCTYQPKDGDAEKLYQHAFNRYIEQGNRPELAKLRARVPFTSQADDHDFLNGWGSLPYELQNSPMYQLIGQIHLGLYLAFQLHSKPEEMVSSRIPGTNGFSTYFDFGDVGLFNLDTRTERSSADGIIMSEQTYIAIEKTYREQCRNKKHVIFNISVPVFYPHFSAANTLLRSMPGYQSLRSDLDDQWKADGHQEERERLVDLLLRLQREFKTRNTIVSGDVHSAAVAKVYGPNERKDSWEENSMVNFTTSPVGNDTPPMGMGYLLSWMGWFEDKVGQVAKSVLESFPGTGGLVSGATTIMEDQNFLSVHVDQESKDLVGAFTFKTRELASVFKVPAVPEQVAAGAGNLDGREVAVA